MIELERVMRGFRHPWFVSGGWAINLFVGRRTREHEDVEVGLFFPHQESLRRHLSDWTLFRIRGDAWVEWIVGDLIALPEFQAQARSDRAPLVAFDIFLNPLDRGEWVSRRHPGLRVAIADLFGRTVASGDAPAGVPYLAPQIQLLYKAKYHRAKDDADFESAVGKLDQRQRDWLGAALRVHHPDDPWIARL